MGIGTIEFIPAWYVIPMSECHTHSILCPRYQRRTHNQIKEFKEKTGVNNSVQNLKALVMALREHLA